MLREDSKQMNDFKQQDIMLHAGHSVINLLYLARLCITTHFKRCRVFDNDRDSNPRIKKASTGFHWSAASRRAARHNAAGVGLVFIWDSSTQLQSWHSSASGWFGVAVFLPPQYRHTGLDWDPPGAWNQPNVFLGHSEVLWPCFKWSLSQNDAPLVVIELILYGPTF